MAFMGHSDLICQLCRHLRNETNTKYLKVNQTATKTKRFSHIADKVALVTDSAQPSALQTIRNAAYLFTIESACTVISQLIGDNPSIPYDDDTMKTFVTDSIKRYETILDLSPKSYSPALLKTFVIGPMSIVNWKYMINKDSPVPYAYPGDLDQGTELLGKVCKDYNVATGHGRSGFMERLMEHMNFAHIGAMQHMVGKWHLSKSDEQALHQPLHKGEYQIEGFTPFFQSVMNAARKYDAKNMLQELYRKGYSEECLADICVGFEQEPHWNLDALNETTPTTIVEKTKKKPSKEYYPYPCRLCSKKYKTLKGYTNHMAKQHATNDKTDDDDDDEYRLQINENGSTKRVQKKQTVQNGSKKRKYSGRKLIKS
eukprot:84171_1